jgi:hypothetical protein
MSGENLPHRDEEGEVMQSIGESGDSLRADRSVAQDDQPEPVEKPEESTDEPLQDIVEELNDWAYIVDSSQGSCLVTFLSGRIFQEAAEEIAKVRGERDGWQAEAAGIVQDLSNAEDDVEDLQQILNETRRILGSPTLLQLLEEAGKGTQPSVATLLAEVAHWNKHYGKSNE